MTQILEFSDTDFKAAFLRKKKITSMSNYKYYEKIEKFSKELEVIRNNQMNNTMIELKSQYRERNGEDTWKKSVNLKVE